MYKVKHLAIIGGLAWGLLVGMSSQAQAQENGVAAVTIRNLTRDTWIMYSFQWGDGDVTRWILLPGQFMYHYFPLDDFGRAPMPHIAFDTGGGAMRQYDLEFYDNFGFRRGNPYFFHHTGIGTLDLSSGPW